MAMRSAEEVARLVLLGAATLALAWVLSPFSGAVLWSIVFAIVFAPLHQRIQRVMSPSHAALATILIVLVAVIVPLSFITASLLSELTAVVKRLQSGEYDLARHITRVRDVLPDWAARGLDEMGFSSVRDWIVAGVRRSSQSLAGQAMRFGQSTFDIVVSVLIMLYLLFYLLLDGRRLSGLIGEAVPLPSHQWRVLTGRVATVVRSVVKGIFVTAIFEGLLGSLMFWIVGVRPALLLGALMAILTLLPLLGPALVWLPVAIYLLVVGAVWQAAFLVACGVAVIGLVDSLMRPHLVGRDPLMPNYLVLISTLGGIVIFGGNGVILGPTIAAIFVACWSVFSRRRAAEGPGAQTWHGGGSTRDDE